MDGHWVAIWAALFIGGGVVGYLVGLRKRPDPRDTHEKID